MGVGIFFSEKDRNFQCLKVGSYLLLYIKRLSTELAIYKHSGDTRVYLILALGKWNPHNGGYWSADLHQKCRFLSYMQTS